MLTSLKLVVLPLALQLDVRWCIMRPWRVDIPPTASLYVFWIEVVGRYDDDGLLAPLTP
jgi:hypothetical protein